MLKTIGLLNAIIGTRYSADFPRGGSDLKKAIGHGIKY